MPIIAKSIVVGKTAVECALKGIPHEKAVEIEQEKLKKMAERAKNASKPRRHVESVIPTEDSDGINIIIKRKSQFLDDLTKE